MAKEELAEFIVKHKISFTSIFVPWSISRNAKHDPKVSDYSLNFKVTMLKNERPVHDFDYQMGIGHCKHKLINPRVRYCIADADAIIAECEGERVTAKPDQIDLLASIAIDSSAINEGPFEDWASNLGYDADSRKAEAIYRTCIDIAVKIRAAFGHEALEELQEAAQDY